MLQGISTGGWYNQPSHVVHHGNQRLFTNISASALINWQSRGLTEGHNLISGVIATTLPCGMSTNREALPSFASA